MPNADTFTIKPIGELVQRYLANASVSIDPFARNNQWADYTNDLNPTTTAQYHFTALRFLTVLHRANRRADVVIFDPPYSLRQTKEVYEGVGIKFTQEDSQQVGHWSKEKEICRDLIKTGGYFLHFGWHSNGMGKKRGFEIVEILLVAHGGCHNDTICTVERKIN